MSIGATCAIELGKAHVVAHRKRDAPERRFDCAGLGARFDRSCLVEAFRPELQAEKVDLGRKARRAVRPRRRRRQLFLTCGDRHIRAAPRSDQPYAVPLRGPERNSWIGPRRPFPSRPPCPCRACRECRKYRGSATSLAPVPAASPTSFAGGSEILLDLRVPIPICTTATLNAAGAVIAGLLLRRIRVADFRLERRPPAWSRFP